MLKQILNIQQLQEVFNHYKVSISYSLILEEDILKDKDYDLFKKTKY